MSLSRETRPARRAVALFALPAVLAASVLLAAPAQAATPTSSAAIVSLSVAALPQIVPDSSVAMVSACAFAQMSPLGRTEVLVLIVNARSPTPRRDSSRNPQVRHAGPSPSVSGPLRSAKGSGVRDRRGVQASPALYPAGRVTTMPLGRQVTSKSDQNGSREDFGV